MISKSHSGLIVAITLMIISEVAIAGKCGPVMNPVTDINWGCMFPMRTGGLVEFSNGQSDPSSTTENIPCRCMKGDLPYLGIPWSYWEPFAIVDTVSDPWCFMPIATDMSPAQSGKLGGSYNRKEVKASVFAQMHYYKYPAFNLLDIFQDLPCNSGEVDFDIALMTEVLPTWNNEIMALLLNPEAVLFGNPATMMACAAEVSTILAAGKALDSLFWCMGSWGSAYPLSGTSGLTDYVEANAAIAAKGLYFAARSHMLKDRAEDICGSVNTPIWRKSHYKMQMMKPVRDSTCREIGKPGILWSYAKNPAFAGDNFSWMLYRKNRCCVGY